MARIALAVLVVLVAGGVSFAALRTHSRTLRVAGRPSSTPPVATPSTTAPPTSSVGAIVPPAIDPSQCYPLELMPVTAPESLTLDPIPSGFELTDRDLYSPELVAEYVGGPDMSISISRVFEGSPAEANSQVKPPYSTVTSTTILNGLPAVIGSRSTVPADSNSTVIVFKPQSHVTVIVRGDGVPEATLESAVRDVVYVRRGYVEPTNLCGQTWVLYAMNRSTAMAAFPEALGARLVRLSDLYPDMNPGQPPCDPLACDPGVIAWIVATPRCGDGLPDYPGPTPAVEPGATSGHCWTISEIDATPPVSRIDASISGRGPLPAWWNQIPDYGALAAPLSKDPDAGNG